MAEGTGYLVAAYVVTWVVLVAFASGVAAGARRAARRLAQAPQAPQAGGNP